MTKDFQRAEMEYKQATNMDATCAEYWFALGTMIADRGDYRSAEVYLKRAVYLNESTPGYFRTLAFLARTMKQPEKERDYYLKAAKLEPNEASNWFNLGLSYFTDSKSGLRRSLTQRTCSPR